MLLIESATLAQASVHSRTVASNSTHVAIPNGIAYLDGLAADLAIFNERLALD
jgi:hypothetical protein